MWVVSTLDALGVRCNNGCGHTSCYTSFRDLFKFWKLDVRFGWCGIPCCDWLAVHAAETSSCYGVVQLACTINVCIKTWHSNQGSRVWLASKAGHQTPRARHVTFGKRLCLISASVTSDHCRLLGLSFRLKMARRNWCPPYQSDTQHCSDVRAIENCDLLRLLRQATISRAAGHQKKWSIRTRDSRPTPSRGGCRWVVELRRNSALSGGCFLL